MHNTSTLLADDAAKNIVKHFQANGFSGISEALVIRIRLKQGSRELVEAAFESAEIKDETPPLQQYFEILPWGFFSDFRSLAEAKSVFQTDFTSGLRTEVPRVFFDAAPVVVDDPLASGTKYDVLMKLRENVRGYAIAMLLNDPDASFLDYVGSHHGNDWQQIMGNFEITSQSLDAEIDLL
ncbi:MAG: hypothetical protein PHH47_03365 [Gallionella sp.]|nr:hypothetical protein [Gallionella sp.]MDD4946246.1 hypothetical protein [Gallionella sp.]MDD5612594.1 hypothetical protein [Gallionella sp.]